MTNSLPPLSEPEKQRAKREATTALFNLIHNNEEFTAVMQRIPTEYQDTAIKIVPIAFQAGIAFWQHMTQLVDEGEF